MTSLGAAFSLPDHEINSLGRPPVTSAFLLGAERVIAIDRFPERLKMARTGRAETINYEETSVYDASMEMTGGRGPDPCIDAVGLEAHGGHMDLFIRTTTRNKP